MRFDGGESFKSIVGQNAIGSERICLLIGSIEHRVAQNGVIKFMCGSTGSQDRIALGIKCRGRGIRAKLLEDRLNGGPAPDESGIV